MTRYKAVILAYLPNKKILFLVVFILLIFAGWFYFSDYKNKQTQYIAEKEKSPLAVALDTTSKLDADSDGDELKDWEELLWKTDSGKADTDGDGTNDNEEITLNRNPLKAGPDDKISEKEDLVAQEKAVSESKQNTLTAVYARQFLTEYLLLKRQKGELDAEDKNNLVEKFMSNMEPLVVADKYKLSDLKITQDNSKEAIKGYSEEMKRIFITNTNDFIDDRKNLEDIFESLKDKSVDNEEAIKIYISSFRHSIKMYEKFLKQLSLLNVPIIVKNQHLEVINGLNNIVIAIKNMVEVVSDPIRAMMGMNLYDEQIKRVFNSTNDIQSVFNNFGIKVF